MSAFRATRTRSPSETLGLGRRLASTIRPGDVVLLRGSIGAGKSVFARGVAEGLGASCWQGSPTFALIHEYDSSPPFYHADLYRLDGPEIAELGLQEYAGQSSILLIEWADRAQEYLADLAPRKPIWVDIGHSGIRERLVTIHAESRRAPAFAEGSLV